MNERNQLEQAIAAQESLRGSLDDAVIDAAIAALKKTTGRIGTSSPATQIGYHPVRRHRRLHPADPGS